MESTEKTETAQNEEYRIEVEDGEKPQNTWFRSDDLSAMLKGLLGMDDEDKPSDEFRTMHTVASFMCALKDIQMIQNHAWSMRLDIEDYLDEDDQAKFMFLKDRLRKDLIELWRITDRYEDNMIKELDVWKDDDEEDEEEEE